MEPPYRFLCPLVVTFGGSYSVRAVTMCMNCRYESTSSESSSESSDDESDASEYHEATEKLPESPTLHPQATTVSSSAVSVPVFPKSTETENAQYNTTPLLLSEGASLTHSPALDTATCQHVTKSPASVSDKWHSTIQSSTTAMAPQETGNLSIESDSIQQYTTQNTAICPEHSSIESSTICMALEQTVDQLQATSSDSQQNSNQPEPSGVTTQQPIALSHTTGASHPADSQSQTTDLTSNQQIVQLKASDASVQQDTGKSPVSSQTENIYLNNTPKQESRCGTSSKCVISINSKCYNSTNESLPLQFQRGTE